MKNLWINETWVNETEGYQAGSSDWYETGHNSIGSLYRELRKLYGKPQDMYLESKEGKSKKIGWVFTGIAKYDDTKEKYTRQTWVEVATEKPITTTTIKIEHAKF